MVALVGSAAAFVYWFVFSPPAAAATVAPHATLAPPAPKAGSTQGGWAGTILYTPEPPPKPALPATEQQSGVGYLAVNELDDSPNEAVLGLKRGKLVWPTRANDLTSDFGYRTNPISGGFQLHRGVDVRAPCGSEVVAAQAGNVSFAEWTDGSGNTIVIKHPGGLVTRYAHLSQLKVTAGMRVVPGQAIGYSGDTGRYSTGPHLHFEVSKDGRPIDPMRFRFHRLKNNSFSVNGGVACVGAGSRQYGLPYESLTTLTESGDEPVDFVNRMYSQMLP